jgi:hypothetical protein
MDKSSPRIKAPPLDQKPPPHNKKKKTIKTKQKQIKQIHFTGVKQL